MYNDCKDANESPLNTKHYLHVTRLARGLQDSPSLGMQAKGAASPLHQPFWGIIVPVMAWKPLAHLGYKPRWWPLRPSALSGSPHGGDGLQHDPSFEMSLHWPCREFTKVVSGCNTSQAYVQLCRTRSPLSMTTMLRRDVPRHWSSFPQHSCWSAG